MRTIDSLSEHGMVCEPNLQVISRGLPRDNQLEHAHTRSALAWIWYACMYV
jgi:hypothetical protein